MEKFEKWFEGELRAGLVDIKVSVRPGATLEQVQNEMLDIEEQIRLGNCKPFPTPTTFLPDHIDKLINSVTL